MPENQICCSKRSGDARGRQHTCAKCLEVNSLRDPLPRRPFLVVPCLAETVFLTFTEFDITSCKPVEHSLRTWRNEWAPWNAKQWDIVWKSSIQFGSPGRGALVDAMTKDFNHDIVLM